MSRHVRLLLTIAVVVGAVGYLVSQVVGEQVAYSMYVDELLAERERFVGRQVRVEGMVEEGSIERRPSTLEHRFRVSRRGRILPVRYTGVVPDTFKDGAGVTVRGRLTAAGYFVADEVVAKCPSRYETQAKKSSGRPGPGRPTPSSRD